MKQSPGYWQRMRQRQDRLSTVLYNLVESIVIGASMLEPYMPETAEKIAKQLNTEASGL